MVLYHSDSVMVTLRGGRETQLLPAPIQFPFFPHKYVNFTPACVLTANDTQVAPFENFTPFNFGKNNGSYSYINTLLILLAISFDIEFFVLCFGAAF